ncbi:MAG: hypothetical protein JWO06_691 [Bacteroidota bacterium]|nr:hypothetical protein [Bacteroidota bacterium]
MDQSRTTEQWYSKLFRVLNSAICFTLAYIIFTYLFWFVTGFVGRACKFDAFVYYFGVKFILNNHVWNKTSVALVYSAGPVFSLMLGLFCLYIYKKVKDAKSLLNVFLIWCFIIGTGIFLSQGVIAILGTYNYKSDYYHGLSVVFSWWKLPVIFIYLLDIPFALLFLYLSVNYARPFLLFAYSFSKVNKLPRRRKYFFETAIVPFAVGAFATSLTTLTHPQLPRHVNIPVHIVYMSVIGAALLLAWYAISFIDVLKTDVTRFKSFQAPNIAFAVLLGIAWLFVYITFRGIYIS